MNGSTVKTMFSLGIIGGATAFMALFGQGQAQAAESVDINLHNNNILRVAIVGAEIGFGQGADGLRIGHRQTDEEAVSYEAGMLLKGSGDGVFYVTEDGNRLHIYDWDTYLQYGFSPTDIVEIDDATLESLPLTGEMTRLVTTKWGHLYWIQNGQRFLVNEWQTVIEQDDYHGLPVTNLSLKAVRKIPYHRGGLTNGTLISHDNQAHYLYDGKLIPAADGSYASSQLLDVPAEVMSLYQPLPYLDRITTTLNTATPTANLRHGPSTAFEIVGTVRNDEAITVIGRNADLSWLQIERNDGQTAWLAARLTHLIEDEVATSLLAVINPDTQQLAPTVITQTETVTISETDTTYQPLYCDQVPLRGFGKVWGNHLEVQNGLGCPYSWQGDEQGTTAAMQTFQKGIMIWLEADTTYKAAPSVYVFFADGTYQRFAQHGPADPEKVGHIPDLFSPLGDKFGKVYWEGTGAQVKKRLGYPTSVAVDSAGAFQQFPNGRMVWLGGADTIFVIYDYGYYDDTDSYIRVHTWQQFEDTF